MAPESETDQQDHGEVDVDDDKFRLSFRLGDVTALRQSLEKSADLTDAIKVRADSCPFPVIYHYILESQTISCI